MFQDRYNRRRSLSIFTLLAGSVAFAGCDTKPYTDNLMTAAKLNEKKAEATSAASLKPEKPKTSSDIERDKFHYKTTVGGKEILLPSEPFLYLPFKKSDFPLPPIVDQGWDPNPNEVAINKIAGHQAIDFGKKGKMYDLELCSPVKGRLIASIEAGWRTMLRPGNDKIFDPVLFEGKPISYGGGIFIEIIMENGQRVQILHMSSLDPSLNKNGVVVFSKPIPRTGGGWTPTLFNKPLKELEANNIGVMVEVGQPIGKVGFTGLGINHLGVIYNGEDWPNNVSETAFTTYDPIGAHPHIATHFRTEDGTKYGVRDFLSGYTSADDYNDNQGNLKIFPGSLAIIKNNEFQYAA